MRIKTETIENVLLRANNVSAGISWNKYPDIKPLQIGLYLVYVVTDNNINYQCVSIYSSDKYWVSCETYTEVFGTVSHWMDLPEDPEEIR